MFGEIKHVSIFCPLKIHLIFEILWKGNLTNCFSQLTIDTYENRSIRKPSNNLLNYENGFVHRSALIHLLKFEILVFRYQAKEYNREKFGEA